MKNTFKYEEGYRERNLEIIFSLNIRKNMEKEAWKLFFTFDH